MLQGSEREHSSNFCEQFEQRPNFASTFKLDGTIRYPYYLEHINVYTALQYCLMVGKALVWKAVTDSALTAALGRSFQSGITSGKKESLYALVRAKLCPNLSGWLKRLLHVKVIP